MADGLYDFSGATPKIKNPMRLLGFAEIIKGLLVLGVAALVLVNVAGYLKVNQALGYVGTGIGFFMLVISFKSIAQGCRDSFRIFVGRNLPVSLAKNLSDTSNNSAVESKFATYTASELHEQLKSRANYAFTEPSTWMAQLLTSLFPSFIIQPVPIRAVLLRVFDAFGKTILSVAVVLVVQFVCFSGMAGDAGDFISDLTLILMSLYTVTIWARIGYSEMFSSTFSLARTFAIAAALPAIAGYAYHALHLEKIHEWEIGKVNAFQHLMGLYDAAFSPVLFFVATVALCLTVGIFTLGMFATKGQDKVAVDVAERIENYQANFEPRDLTSNMESIVWNNYRLNKIPNRFYEKTSNYDASSFSMDYVVESQPEFKERGVTKTGQVVRGLTAALYAALAALPLGMLYIAFNDFVTDFPAMMDVFAGNSIKQVEGIDAIFAPALSVLSMTLWAFMIYSVSIAYSKVIKPFVSEVRWVSRLVTFEARGNAKAAMQRTGNQIKDSHLTENEITRCSTTYNIWAANIETVTFVNLQGRGLRCNRMIMSFTPDDVGADQILDDINGFVGTRSNVVTAAQSEVDMQDVAQVEGMNTRAAVAQISATNQAQAAVAAGVLTDDLGKLDSPKADDAGNALDNAVESE